MRQPYADRHIAEQPQNEKSRTPFVCALTRIFATLAVFFALAGSAFAGSITLAWDPSQGADVAGYIVLYGTAPGFYTGSLNVGNQTTAIVRGLAGGQTYYFAIEAYSSAGVVSVLSNEVSGTTTNTPPQLSDPGTQTNDEGATVSLAISAIDADGDPLTYIATGLPLGVFINSTTGVISGTLEYTEAGSHAVTITVSDGSTFASVGFTWNVQAVDRVPILTGPANQSSPVGGVVSLQVHATDPDGDPLTYGASGLPPELSINTATGLIAGTLTGAGSYNVTVTVSDGTLTSNASFTWTVLASNSSPALASIADQESSVVNPVSLPLSASDPDGNTLVFSSSSLPPGLNLDALTGLITGTPTIAGTYSVTATVSDGVATASRTFNWVIDPNNPPLITNPGDRSSVEGQFVSLQIVASDPEGRPLIYTSSLPFGLSISDQGLITGMVPTGSSGVYSASVTVSDGVKQSSVSFQWTITVPSPTPPIFVTQANFAVDKNDVGPNRADLSVNVTGTNPMLIVSFHSEFDGGDTNWTVEDNGVQGTLLASLPGYNGGSDNTRFRVYYWLNPPQGNNAIVVQNSFTGSNELAAAAILLNNVAQANPLGALATDLSAIGRTSETETVATTTSDLVIHVIADALMIRGTLGSGETSVSVANDGLQKSSTGDGDASLWISTKSGGGSSTTVSSSGWASSPAPAPRPLNAVAFAVHGASVVPVPDLTVTSTHVGSFSRGQAGAIYTLTTTNIGTAATVGVVTISDVLPAGLTATAMSGSGWTCSVVTLSCSRTDALAAGASYPTVALTTTVATDAPAMVTNTVTVSGNEINTINDTATDATQITVPGAPATPAFLQANYSTPQSNQIAVPVTYPAAQTVGHLNVVVIGWNDPARRVQSVTDSTGNAYVLAIGPTLQANLGGQSIYYAKNIGAAAAGTNTVTVTFDGSTAFPDIRIAEYSGIDDNAVDVSIAGQGSSATSDSGAVNTTSVIDLLVAADLVATSTAGPGSGYTSRVITTPDGDILMDRVVTSTGSYSATATLSVSGPWIMQLVAFRASGSTGSQTPIITSRAPASGPVGTTVTLSGITFGATQGTSTVTLNGTPAAVSSWSDTSVAVVVPAGATSGNIIVTVGGLASNGMSFVVLPTPTLTYRTPSSGPSGTLVSIIGTNFGATQGTSTVTFNGTVTTPTFWSDTMLSVPVPPGATSGNIVVTVGGVASNGLPFTVRHAPTLASIANQTNAENDTVSVTVTGTDPDGETLTFSAAHLPPGLSIDPSTGTMTGTLTYTSAGTYNVTVTASDDVLSASRNFTWTVTNVNRAPVVASMGNLTTVTGAAIAIQASATDADGDAISYDATGLPAGVTIDSGTGALTGAPSVSGIYNVSVLALDGSASGSVSFVWTVTAAPAGRVTFIQAHSSSVVNDVASVAVSYPSAQVAGSLALVVVGWMDPVAQVLSVSDATGNTYQLAVGPTTRPDVGNQSIYYAPNVAAAPVGANLVTVTFTTPAAKAEVRVVEYQGIEPSNVVDVTAAAQGNSGDANSGSATTTFRNDLLFGAVWASWATTAPVDGLTARLTTASGALLEDATVSAIGSYSVGASVDPPSPWIIQMVAFRDANHAPLLTNPGSHVNALNSSVSLSLSASDVDGDSLTFSATGLPPGLSLNTATGVISGILSWSSAGAYSVIASVSDGLLTTSAAFSWTVTGAAVSASSTSLNPGNQLTVSWSGIAAPTATDWIGLFAAAAADNSSLALWYTTGTASGSRVVTLPATLAAGPYELRLFAHSNLQRLAVSPTLAVTGATLTAGPATVGTGGTVTATWSGIATPTATDWIVLVHTGAADTNYIAWWYTTGTNGGSRNLTLPASATPGTYELRVFAQDSWRRLAVSNTITVQATSLTASPAIVLPGETVTATWSSIGSPSAADWITLVKTGAADNGYVVWGYTNGTSTGSQTLTVPKSAPPGTYELRLFANGTWKRLAVSNTITIPAVTLTATPATLAPGGTLTLAWQNIGLPTTTDWLALIPTGAADGSWVAWVYATGLRKDATPFTIPANLASGTYEVRLFANGTFKRLAVSNTITVTAPGPSVAVTAVSAVPGGDLTVNWRNISSPTTTDWVGLYLSGAADPDYVTRIFTSGRAADRMLMTLPGNISTGSYELRLFSNNTLTRLATSNGLEVVPGAGISADPVIVPRGSTLNFSWAGISAPTSTDWVALTPVGALNPNWVAWRYTTGAASGSLSLTIPSNLATGAYELRLYSQDTFQRLAVSNAINVGPTLTVTPTPVAPGGTMTVTWAGIPGPTSTDWMALVPLNETDNHWVAWIYTNGAAAGSKAFVIPSNLAAGVYDVRMWAHDTFTRLGLSNVITITSPGPSVAASPVTTTAGSTITASWKSIAAPTATDWIGVYTVGAADNAYITRVFTGGLATGSTPLVLPGGLASGQYELRLFANDTLTRLAVGNSFTIP